MPVRGRADLEHECARPVRAQRGVSDGPRVAEVATAATVWAPSMASGCSALSAPNSPSPRRTGSFCRVMVLQERSGSRRTTIRRTELVPTSMKPIACGPERASDRVGLMRESAWRGRDRLAAQDFRFFLALFFLAPFFLPPFLACISLRSSLSLSRPLLLPYTPM